MQIEPLVQECSELRAQLAEKEQDLRVKQREWDELERAWNAIKAGEGRDKSALTIKEAVMTVLADNPGGLTSNQILQEINARFYEGRLKRESLSPQLTRLKHDDKKLILKGAHWLSKGDSEVGDRR